jgi:hypothetical protein
MSAKSQTTNAEQEWQHAARVVCALIPGGSCVTDAEIAAGTHERCTSENCDAMRYARAAINAASAEAKEHCHAQTTAPDAALRLLEAALSAERLAQIDAIVTGKTPMERWERHTGVTTFAHLREWAERQLREVMTMRAYRDISNDGIPKDDELGDYLVGKSGALSMMLANMRQIAEHLLNSATPTADAAIAHPSAAMLQP